MRNVPKEPPKAGLIIYSSWLSIIDKLDEHGKSALLQAFADYFRYGTANIDPSFAIVWDMFAESIDSNIQKYESVCEENRLKSLYRAFVGEQKSAGIAKEDIPPFAEWKKDFAETDLPF